MQILHPADVPRGDIAVEGSRPAEHRAHVYHAARVPGREVATERRGVAEHISHGRDVARVPRGYVAVERPGEVEDFIHARYAAGVPAGDILVEGGERRAGSPVRRGAEQVRHVRHGASIPRGDVPVDFRRGGWVVAPRPHRVLDVVVGEGREGGATLPTGARWAVWAAQRSIDTAGTSKDASEKYHHTIAVNTRMLTPGR